MPQEERKHIVFRAVRGVVNALMLGALVYSLFAITFQHYWIPFVGNMSAFSLGSMVIIYLLLEFSLIRAELGWIETLVWPALFANAYLQSYEVIYHFSFPIYLNYFHLPILTGEGIRYLIERALTIIPIVLIRKYLSPNKLALVSLALFTITWAVWILYGFPQYFHNGYFYPLVLRTNDPFRLSLIMNFGSKLLFATFFLSLVNRDFVSYMAVKRILTKQFAPLFGRVMPLREESGDFE